jgi:LssY C-terminus
MRTRKTMDDSSLFQRIVAAIVAEFAVLVGSALLLSSALSARDLPVGTVLEVRLSGATGSRISHAGDPIEATIIAPVSIDGQILVPQGSRLFGSIAAATALGFGFKHSTASMAFGFDTLQLPDGAAIPVKTQLVEVETAKEHVDDFGTVHGIHPIASVSSSVSFYTVPLLLLQPEIGIPIWGMKSLIAPSANPEIRFPVGTELNLRLTTAATLPASNPDSLVSTKSFSPDDLVGIERLVKNSPQRAYMGSRPSDLVNVVVIGSWSQVDRAFAASGWSVAQRKSPLSLYRMYHALTRRRGYPKAPMNALTLDGVSSVFERQKSLDTVEKRHHVRLWQQSLQTGIWLGAAAEDVGFQFKLTHWTHSTDPDIDRERAKIVNDLAFTGCVDSAGLLSRVSADLVQDTKAEHPILTDGDIAVIRLNDCTHPNLMAGVEETFGVHKPGRLVRSLSTLRDDLVRSNMFFTAYNTLRSIAKHKTESSTIHAQFVTAEPRGLDWLTSTAPLPGRPRP